MPLRIYAKNESIHRGRTDLEFNQRLQWRGSDIKLFTNTGYEKDPHDSDIFACIATGLLEDHGAGVEHIEVKPFKIHILHSRAVTFEDIKMRLEAILLGCLEPGEFEWVN